MTARKAGATSSAEFDISPCSAENDAAVMTEVMDFVDETKRVQNVSEAKKLLKSAS